MVDTTPELRRLHLSIPQFAHDGNYRWRVIGKYIMEKTDLVLRGCGNTWTTGDTERILNDCVRAIITSRGHAVAIRKMGGVWYYLRTVEKLHRKRRHMHREAAFETAVGDFLKEVLGSRRAAGAGGAVADREEGERVGTWQTRLKDIERQYSPESWCPGRVPEKPRDLEWWEDLMGAQAWAKGDIYKPLEAEFEEEEVIMAFRGGGVKHRGARGSRNACGRNASGLTPPRWWSSTTK